MRLRRHVAAAAIFLVATLGFFRLVLFSGEHTVPWDFRGHHYPLAAAFTESLHEGVLPLWEPYSYCGRPLLANPQTAAFYPGTWLLALGPREDLLVRMEWLFAAHVLLAAFVAYLLASRFTTRFAAALVAGFVYGFGAPTVSQAQHLSAILNAPWLALAWLALLLRPPWRLALLVVCVTASVLIGFTGYTLALCGAALLFALARSWRIAAETFAAFAIAGGLAAVQLLPSMELARHSVGAYRTDWIGLGGGISPAALPTLLAANARGAFTASTAWGEPTTLYLYCGVTALLLAAVAIRRTAVPLWICAAAFLLLLLGEHTPAAPLLFRALPHFLQAAVYWHLFLVPFSLALALLAAFGAARLNPRLRVVAVAAVAADLFWAGSGRPLNTQRITPDSIADYGVVEGAAKNWSLVKNLVGHGRLDTMGDSLIWTQAAPLTRIRAASGYDPLALQRITLLRLAFARGERWGATFQVEQPEHPAVDMSGVTALITRLQFHSPAWRETAAIPGHWIYRNTEALPRYRLVRRAIPAPSAATAARLVKEAPFDAREAAVVEGPAFDGGPGERQLRLIEEDRQRAVLESLSNRPSLLVTAESHYPGWEATIDGKPAPVYYTNVAFRGVPVPAGRHRIEFQFRPRLPLYGGLITGATSILLGLYIFVSRKRYADSRTASGSLGVFLSGK